MSRISGTMHPVHRDTLGAVLADISAMAVDGMIQHIDASDHGIVTRDFARNPVPVHLEALGGSSGGLPMILVKGVCRGGRRRADVEWIDPPDLSAADLWRAAAALARVAKASCSAKPVRQAAGIALKAESENGGGLALGRLRTPWTAASISTLRDEDRRPPSDRILGDAEMLPAAVLVKASFRTNVTAGDGPAKIKTLLVAPVSINANICRDDALESLRVLDEVEDAIARGTATHGQAGGMAA
jgi:hypothetical protein